ncbi:leucyl aminopeptidase [Methylopila jiangsuensis]|uniref:Leucyl aminopeptidase n=1 Tax=Methylopila jiangsuensis TaxID=586230 RepID=A0A9W6JGV9_9HYPH|nr:leucyl aminopeptidase family protein [Methylopila jiangsuensis]MDR6285224.1 leucyl aminopeptidase [Methylopila jiangsuensis]GLK77386.1 leucyl aminopeptidase [Methylopila jiangsuensis]
MSVFADAADAATPVWFTPGGAPLPEQARRWAEAAGFENGPGKTLLTPDEKGGLAGVLFGVESDDARQINPFLAGRLVGALPAGTYRFEGAVRDARLAALGFALGAYRFTRYGKLPVPAARVATPEGVDRAELERTVAAVTLGRDLVNTPANDLGPAELEAAIRALGQRHGASVSAIVGDDLLGANFPLVHAVGRAAAPHHAPRVVNLLWGPEDAPKVTLVGKGVTFDTGGLNIKPDASMLLMKKDMGGAAAMIALADMVMGAKLPVRLRLIVGAVENAISGDAFRPGDVIPSRKGLSVEIGNTDAEGRLVLADCLALGDEEAPELIVDAATLTGAARVALGPDLPPLYTDDETLAADLLRHAAAEHDPLWRMPLWNPYDDLLSSKIADVNHISGGAFAGSVTAALFLRRFVGRARSWAHLDVFAWAPSPKPGRPEGGEVQGARALAAMLAERYST